MVASKFTSERAELIIQRVREGLSFSSACESVGIHKDTGSGWRQEHSDFSDAVRRAEKESEVELLAIVREAAIGYEVRTEKITISDKDGEKIEETRTLKKSPNYATWILSRRFPSQWSEQYQVEKLVRVAVREVIKNIMEYSSDSTRTEVATIIAARPEIMEVDPRSLETNES